MKVTVAGPESSGTRLLTRLVEALGVEAVHRSVPYGREWWPDRGDADRTHMLVITRDREKTLLSQRRAGHLDAWRQFTPDEKWHTALGYCLEKSQQAANIDEAQTRWLTYEGLIADPQGTMDDIARWLGVPPAPVTEEIDTDR